MYSFKTWLFYRSVIMMYYFALFGCRKFDQIIQNQSNKAKEKKIQMVNFDLRVINNIFVSCHPTDVPFFKKPAHFL